MAGALDTLAPKLTPEQVAEERTIRERGTSDPRVIGEGTIAYLITLDDGFRIMYRDSGGRVTDYEKAAMQRAGAVDLALVAVSADFLNPLHRAAGAGAHAGCTGRTSDMPAHHDGSFGSLWRATEPVFQALKDANPNLITVSRGYREPVCFNTDVNSYAQPPKNKDEPARQCRRRPLSVLPQ